MKVSDVDIEIIYKLLMSVPQGMQIESIDLTNGYSLKLIAGTEEITAVETETSLKELSSILRQYKQLDVGNSNRKLNQSKNYLAIKKIE